jgi:hypothetical protein
VLKVRDLTDEEVDFFAENGWVHARELINKSFAHELYDRAKNLMGAHATIATGAGGGATGFQDYTFILRNHLGAWQKEPLMRELSHCPILARNASRLLRGKSIRFFNDEILVKPPIEEGGKATPWHQDLPHAPFDRSGLVNIWFALVDLPIEGGSMSFVSGSHKFGSFGRTLLEADDALAQNNWLADECEIVPSIAMNAGDATIHGDLTVHGGMAYHGPHWRWAYLVNLMAANVRNAGGPSYGEDISYIEPNARFPDDRFPILYDASLTQ